MWHAAQASAARVPAAVHRVAATRSSAKTSVAASVLPARWSARVLAPRRHVPPTRSTTKLTIALEFAANPARLYAGEHVTSRREPVPPTKSSIETRTAASVRPIHICAQAAAVSAWRSPAQPAKSLIQQRASASVPTRAQLIKLPIPTIARADAQEYRVRWGSLKIQSPAPVKMTFALHRQGATAPLSAILPCRTAIVTLQRKARPRAFNADSVWRSNSV
jgi:hypothetical protein